MNTHRRLQVVPAPLVTRCRQWGIDMVKWYAQTERGRAAVRGASGRWGAEKDPVLQAQSKAGEVATALLFGLDPGTAVLWTLTQGHDKGHDVVLRSRTKIDVKTNEPHKRMIWSKEINHLYLTKDFDVLLAASIVPSDLSHCWLEGWISKGQFWREKQIADGADIGRGLDAGTWFFEKAKLHPIETMLDREQPRQEART